MKKLEQLGLARALRVLSMAGLAAGILVSSASTASAQIHFGGNTSFQFNGVGAFNSTLSLGGLTLTNTGFSTTTNSHGTGFIGGANSSFGTVSLTESDFTYDDNAVSILVNFNIPTVADQEFSALITGEVFEDEGGLGISFDPSTITNIPFTSGTSSGTFSLTINPVSITPDQQNVLITGSLHTTLTIDGNQVATPEPASMVLVATGLFGVLGVARRRRNA